MSGPLTAYASDDRVQWRRFAACFEIATTDGPKYVVRGPSGAGWLTSARKAPGLDETFCIPEEPDPDVLIRELIGDPQ